MNDYGYGLWALVVFNSLLFIVFAVSFFHPKSKRDWRALGGFSAFVVALFTEMYGYPLTVYLLTGPLGGLIPGVNLSHNAGHLWTDLIGWKGDPHVSPFHLASYAFIIGGFWLIAAAWRVLYAAQKNGELATSGPYARVRHPAVSRLDPDHGRLPAAVADVRDARHVPDPAGRLPPAGDPGGARRPRGVRRRL